MIGAILWFVFGAALYGLGYLVGSRRWEEDRDGAWLSPDRRKWRP